MAAMDLDVDPCKDFYQYACGKWIRTNPIPDGKAIWGTFDRLWQENQIVMKTVLGETFVTTENVNAPNLNRFSSHGCQCREERSQETLNSDAERKAQRYYESCLDVNETMEALGSRPMMDMLAEIGGWSAVDPSVDIGRWDLQKSIQVTLNKFNIGGFFTWAVAEDDKNSSRYVIQIDQGGLTLPNRDYYLNKTDTDEILVALSNYMVKVRT